MIQIGDVVVSLDVFQEKFLCDLGACKGCLLYTSTYTGMINVNDPQTVMNAVNQLQTDAQGYMDRVTNGDVPVSYTHLDVYKRQT